MKHSTPITILLLSLFVLSQCIGLFVLSFDGTSQTVVSEDNVSSTKIVYSNTTIGERPEFENESTSIWYLVIGVGIATGLLFVLMRFRSGKHIWKTWYALAVMLSISVLLGVFLTSWIALLIALVLMILKLSFASPLIHNTTEVLVYAGIAFLIAPLFQSVWSAVLLLLIISVYDMYAVWKSKHMITLAKFTSKSNIFAGFSIPYSSSSRLSKKVPSKFDSLYQTALSTVKNTVRSYSSKAKSKITFSPQKKYSKKSSKKSAILGGGDVVFPLIFSGAVLQSLMVRGVGNYVAFAYTLIVVCVAVVSLALLFFLGKKDRFYPAMPFLTAGCLVGYALLELVLFLL
ncbi:MAG: presenilin family intramembrane aspartyl protease [Nanobdellota archaeon]